MRTLLFSLALTMSTSACTGVMSDPDAVSDTGTRDAFRPEADGGRPGTDAQTGDDATPPTDATVDRSAPGIDVPEPPLAAPGVLDFVDQTDAIVRGTCVSDETFGRSFNDLNGDGHLDFMTLDHQGRSSCLFENRGDGTFAHSPSTTADWRRGSYQGKWYAAFVDITGDGKEDALGGGTGGSTLYFNATGAVGSEARLDPQGMIPGAGTNERVWVFDYDGDHEMDILMSGGNIVDVASGRVETRVGSGDLSSAIIFDLNEDGWLDVLFFGGDEAFLNDQDGTFSSTTFDPDLSVCGEGGKAFQMDYDLDGDFDLFCEVNGASVFPAFRLFRHDGGGDFVDVTEASVGLMDSSHSANKGAQTIADLDNDGHPEFIDFNNYQISREDLHGRGGTVVYHNLGGGIFEKTFIRDHIMDSDVNGGGGGKNGGDAADINGDGLVDLIDSGPSARFGGRLLRNRTVTDHHWLAMHLRGEGGNTYCVGCVVEVFDATTGARLGTQMVRPMVRGGYTLSRLHAGLGRATSVDLVVRFSNGGGTQRFDDVGVDQRIQIVHGAVSITNDYVPGAW